VDELKLRSFLTVAECGSITHAAARLGMAQPSLSQQLLRLEDEIGGKLFTRTSQGVTLTRAGQIFQEHAQVILGAMRSAREEVGRHETNAHGEVSLGLPHSTDLLLGLPLLSEIHRKLPQVSLTIRNDFSKRLKVLLEQGRLDIAILFRAERIRNLSVKRLVDETLFLVGPPNAFGEVDKFGIAKKRVHASMLAHNDLILPAYSNNWRKFFASELENNAKELRIWAEIDSFPHIKSLVRDGCGYSLLPYTAVSNELGLGELVAARLDGIDLTRSVWLARNRMQPTTRAGIEVENIIVRMVEQMVQEGQWIL
jgi:LysR family transcriptional regulator, nitrogen assimilation regulatory protein